MMRSVRWALFWTCCLRTTAACPFGGKGPLPMRHPALEGSRSLSSYPGWIVDDTADSEGSLSTAWPHAPDAPWNDHLAELTQKSTELDDAELCYWSFQTLPGPDMMTASPSVTSVEVDLWFNNTNGEAPNFADMAVKRMQNLVGDTVMWTGCAVGQTLRRAMCDAGREVSSTTGARLEDCSIDAVYNQTLMVPTAIVIFKFSNSTVDALKNVLTTWRTDDGGHYPQMMSDLVHTYGWGPGGQIISKTVLCSEIPDRFKYQNLGDCDEMGDAQLLADEAFETWSGLCSITKSSCPTTTDSGNTTMGASTTADSDTANTTRLPTASLASGRTTATLVVDAMVAVALTSSFALQAAM